MDTKKTKPTLFIASSVEGLGIADAINANLEHDAHCTLWRTGTFKLSSQSVDDLVKKSSAIDFAVFAFTPDDVSKIRNHQAIVARDNVVFELGLFIGAIGKDRCYVIKPRDVDMHLPSDLLGMNVADYATDRPDADIASALNYACKQVKDRIADLGAIARSPIVRADSPARHVANPPEPAIANSIVDQPQLRRRLAQLAPGRQGYAVQDPTKFKYLAAHATASSQVADRLWKVYEAAPHYYPQLAKHLAKFEILPTRQAIRLSDAIEAQELYPAVRAELIRAGVGRFPREGLRKARARIKALWKPKLQQPDLAAAIWSWLQEQSHLTSAQQRYALTHAGPSWLLATLHYETRWLDMGTTQRETLLNHSLRSSSADVAMAAAWISSFANTRVARPIRDIHPQAKILLKELGVVRRANPAVCGIRSAIHEMAGQDIAVDWRKLFAGNYKQSEAQIVMCKGYFKTNPTAWVNATDSFIDWLLVGLFAADPSLGTYQIGNVGGISNSARLRAKHPALLKLLTLVHGKRLESHLSHAVTKTTQRPTRTIPFRWLRTGAIALRRAAIELLNAGY